MEGDDGVKGMAGSLLDEIAPVVRGDSNADGVVTKSPSSPGILGQSSAILFANDGIVGLGVGLTLLSRASIRPSILLRIEVLKACCWSIGNKLKFLAKFSPVIML